jgi:hypothetical protein
MQSEAFLRDVHETLLRFCGCATASTDRRPPVAYSRPKKAGCPTRGVMYYYCGTSKTPMEDNILLAPFDDPSNLAKNVETGVVKGVAVTVHDGRVDNELMGRGTQPMRVLDTRGLLLQQHVSKVSDFWDEAQVLSLHYPEMQRLSQELTKCDRTAVAAHALRGNKTEMGRPAAYFVHNDFSDRLKALYGDLIASGDRNIITDAVSAGGLGVTSEQFEAGRLVVLNYWRPMQKEPIQRNPLAVIDSTTMQRSEVVQFPHYMRQAYGSFVKFFRIPTNPHVNVGIRPSDEHRWYYFPGMTRDEVLAFKNYDSSAPQPGNGIGMHTSFDDPNTPASAPSPRESIEIRVLCFWFGAGDGGR